MALEQILLEWEGDRENRLEHLQKIKYNFRLNYKQSRS